jgi:hypothetical protein
LLDVDNISAIKANLRVRYLRVINLHEENGTVLSRQSRQHIGGNDLDYLRGRRG